MSLVTAQIRVDAIKLDAETQLFVSYHAPRPAMGLSELKTGEDVQTGAYARMTRVLELRQLVIGRTLQPGMAAQHQDGRPK